MDFVILRMSSLPVPAKGKCRITTSSSPRKGIIMDGSKDLVFFLCIIIIPISAIVSLTTFRSLVKGCANRKLSAIKLGISTGLGLSCSIPLYHTWVYWIALTAFPFFLCIVLSMLALLLSFAITSDNTSQHYIDKEQRDSIDAATHRE